MLVLVPTIYLTKDIRGRLQLRGFDVHCKGGRFSQIP